MRIVYAIMFVALTGCMAWGVIAGDADAYLARLPQDVWLQVTLADLYAGIAVYAALVWCIERSVTRTLLWVLPALPLGNLWTLVYVIARWPTITARTAG